MESRVLDACFGSNTVPCSLFQSMSQTETSGLLAATKLPALEIYNQVRTNIKELVLVKQLKNRQNKDINNNW